MWRYFREANHKTTSSVLESPTFQGENHETFAGEVSILDGQTYCSWGPCTMIDCIANPCVTNWLEQNPMPTATVTVSCSISLSLSQQQKFFMALTGNEWVLTVRWLFGLAGSGSWSSSFLSCLERQVVVPFSSHPHGLSWSHGNNKNILKYNVCSSIKKKLSLLPSDEF